MSSNDSMHLLYNEKAGAPRVAAPSVSSTASALSALGRVLRCLAFALLGACALSADVAACASALGEGRVYEQVSPFYKGGYGVGTIKMVSPDGDRVAFDGLGVYAGAQWDTLENPYMAERVNGMGWSTSSIQPPPVRGGVMVGLVGGGFSSDLQSAEAKLSVGKTKTGIEGPETGGEWLLHRVGAPDTPENWIPFDGRVLTDVNGEPFKGIMIGSSGDLCHLFLKSEERAALLPEGEGVEAPVYDESRGCGGSEPYLRLVALTNGEPAQPISRECPAELGSSYGGYYKASPNKESGLDESNATFNETGTDGRVVFFTESVSNVKSGHCTFTPFQLFVRLGGERTVEVSRPLSVGRPFGGCGEGGNPGEAPGEVPCLGAASRASATFRGASEDGSRVFFTTAAPLSAEDADTKSDLYMATLGCPVGEAGCKVSREQVTRLVQVSHDPNPGQAAEVQGVVRIASDGLRVYFVARGALTDEANASGETPSNGADNLYVYDVQAGKTAFVAQLCSGPQLSGSVEDTQCPRSLDDERINDRGFWGDNNSPQSTRDGRFLVFSSYGQLTPDDTDSALDVYRYDAVTGALERVSIGEEGYDANGNSDAFDAFALRPGGAGINPGPYAATQLELASRSISDDGSRIVFTTSEPLSARAVNGKEDVYVWHAGAVPGEGSVSLVSGGAALADDRAQTISPSGRDIFFVSGESLVPGDTDVLEDVYDARIGGGFPQEGGSPRASCSSDACQGPLTNPAPLLVPGSAEQASGGNFASPAAKKTAVKRRVKRKRSSAGSRRHRKRRKARKAGRGRMS